MSSNATHSDALSGPSQLTVSSYLCLIAFVLAVIPVLAPFRIPIHRRRKLFVDLNLVTSPIIAIIFLLCTRAIEPHVVLTGLAGTQQLQPYSILILFYSIAYICISLDITGFLKYTALWCVKRTGRNGRKTFLYFFILTLVASGLTSNDAVILTATAFLVHFTSEAKVADKRAFLMSEFVSANIASMALYIGNPTNVVVAQANGIGFAEYSAWMIIPTIACAVLAYVMLRYVLFNRDETIPKNIEVDADSIQPRKSLKDPWGALFGCLLLGFCLVALMVTSVFHVPVWMVTLPFAGVAIVRDIWYDMCIRRGVKGLEEPVELSGNREEVAREGGEGNSSEILFGLPGSQQESNAELVPKNGVEFIVASTDAIVEAENTSTDSFPHTKERSTILTVLEDQRPQLNTALWRKIRNKSRDVAIRLPTITEAFGRLPWPILPFSLCMFILVESLSFTGWISILASVLAKLSPSFVPSIFSTGIITVILCSLLNNLPATILLTRVLLHPNYLSAIGSSSTPQSNAVRVGAIYALVAGSNVGAILTICGSLAGIMWEKIVRDMGVKGLEPLRFFILNLALQPVLIVGACAVICVEVYVVYLRGM